MQLEFQVSNKELSKRLEELGVKQESLWYHDLSYGKGQDITRVPVRVYSSQEVNPDFISAFTVAELGEMLPIVVNFKKKIPIPKNRDTKRLQSSKAGRDRLEKMRSKGILQMSKSNGYILRYVPYEILEGFNWVFINDDNEANARTKMLIYLLENNLIKL